MLKLNLPEDWRKAGVLYLTAFDPAGKEVWTCSWGIQKESESWYQYVKKESKKNSEISLTEGQEELLVKVDGLKLSFSKKTGELAKVEKDGRTISVENGRGR